MTAIGIRYLTGYSAATDLSSDRPEWPPHPGRVFMALAAAYFETRGGEREVAALEWLEAQPAPALRASADNARTAVEAYVPVNDDHGGVFGRSRQLRKLQRTRPVDDVVYLVWSSDASAEIRDGLAHICSRVTRIGHSSSLTQMWVAESDEVGEANWLPSENSARVRLRVPTSGTLKALKEAFKEGPRATYEAMADTLDASRGQRKKALKAELEERFPNGAPVAERPQLTTWQGYAERRDADRPEVIRGPFDPNFIIFSQREGRTLGLESTLQLTGALRNAAMKAAEDRPPEWLSGHTPDGKPTAMVHTAFFPLPFVGYSHADGHILGLGLALPREISHDNDARKIIGTLLFRPDGEPRVVRLWRDGAWEWTVERETRERPPVTLTRERWTGPSRRWASVTPVVLHHHPKASRAGDVERIVKEAFASALLPQPERVTVRSASAHEGAGHALGLPPFDEGGAKLCRYQVHVTVDFAQPVEGPVLVGRGRYRGYGVFAPVRGSGA